MDKKSDSYKQAFAKNFNRELVNSRLKKKDVAKRLGVSNTTITNWSQGKQVPEGHNLNKLADLFQIAPKTLNNTYTDEELMKLHDELFFNLLGEFDRGTKLADFQIKRDEAFEKQHPETMVYDYLSDDMEPTIPKDSVLDVDSHCQLQNGMIGLFWLKTHRSASPSFTPHVAKRVWFNDDKTWTLVNDNYHHLERIIVPDLNTHHLYDPVDSPLYVNLIGVVTGYRHRFYN
ncbi:helix-turn-helix domain-containing protein [Nicoliella spurrieriana]|uniref:Helix-turn-helix domain-containing protein n=1 Tax=Nicoliella spurrieriana TaxID=2925830 RepID=A0A976X5G1_9LACO|nr:helix-turn-helix transcriptional regulator [Nicoliella spurrieriana]UQS86865.1 helix-turn-helix domain-containing protein [Nicoliella spurrieriana]